MPLIGITPAEKKTGAVLAPFVMISHLPRSHLPFRLYKRRDLSVEYSRFCLEGLEIFHVNAIKGPTISVREEKI